MRIEQALVVMSALHAVSACAAHSNPRGAAGTGAAGGAAVSGSGGASGVNAVPADASIRVLDTGTGANGDSAIGTGSAPDAGSSVVAPKFPSGLLEQRWDGCVIGSDGGVHCWDQWLGATDSKLPGMFDALYLGLGANARVSTPTRCARNAAGDYSCTWGGDVRRFPSMTTDYVQMGGSSAYLQLALGESIGCALLAGGKVQCWDRNGTEFADGDSRLPKGTFVQIDTDGAAFCGLHPDGTGECWNNAPAGYAFPKAERFVQISTRTPQILCGITLASHVVCWGGFGTLQVPVPTGVASAVSVGSGHACALMQDGHAECFGNGASLDNQPHATMSFREVSAGNTVDCGIDTTGQVWCWGFSYFPQKMLDLAGAPLIAKTR